MGDFQAVSTAAARVIGKRAGRNRIVRGVYGGVTAGVRSLGRVLHLLFLEVTGFIFLVLSLALALTTRREWVLWTGGDHSGARAGKLGAAAVFTLMFGYFGITSFFRARKRSRLK